MEHTKHMENIYMLCLYLYWCHYVVIIKERWINEGEHMNNYKSICEQVDEIEKRCYNREITPRQAIEQIDVAIGGITSTVYKEGLKFKIINHKDMYSMISSGIRNRDIPIMQQLAVLGYAKARENGSIRSGEIHISREASTKDHMNGIEYILQKAA